MRCSIKKIAFTVFVALLSVFIIKANITHEEPGIIIQIDPEQVSYFKSYCFSLGPKTVRKDDSPELFFTLLDIVNGEYDYYDTCKRPEAAGGGPAGVGFYDQNDEQIYLLRFSDDHIYVPYKNGKYFKRYKRNDDPQELNRFFMSLYGVTQ